MHRRIAAALAAACILSASAMEVVFDDRSPQDLREWVDASYLRQQMEVTAPKICKLLYGGTGFENYSEKLTIRLFLSTQRGGNPAWASGKTITWKAVGYKNKGSAVNGVGVLGHEMTHVLDRNTWPMSVQKFRKHHDSPIIEGTAVWVTDYNIKYGYRKYSSPSIVLDRRYDALRGRRKWGKYRDGAAFFDFLEQAYGEGTAVKVIRDVTAHGKDPWPRVLGKSLEQLVEEWRSMETIYDPVFQWNYNGTAEGAVRRDGKFCPIKEISAENAGDRSGAWLSGTTGARIKGISDGNITIALHGRFPAKPGTAIASLGSATDGCGKAVLIATSLKKNALEAHVVATLPGKGCQVVSSTAFPLPESTTPVPHSLILTVKGGNAAAVVVDGRPAAKIDMKSKCEGCTFAPVFAVGGMSGGFGVAGFSEARGDGGVLLDDVRVFTRTFRKREISQYASIFGPDYRGAVAVEATWRGPQGGKDLDNPDNWTCFNAYGEKIVAVPTKETDVLIWFREIPSIPPKAKFACKSFTIDGIAVVDQATVDLRGVRIVNLTDNTRIITANGHSIAMNAVKGGRVRIEGSVAVTAGMKLAGNIQMKSGSSLRLPDNPAMTLAKSISVKGDGPVAIRPVSPPKRGYQNILRLETMPEDFSQFKLNLSDDQGAATFKPSTDGKFLGAFSR